MSDEAQTPQPANFVRVPQSFTDFADRPLRTLDDVFEIAKDLGKGSHVKLGVFAIKPTWGTIVYKIADDGSLTLHAKNVDTSD